MLFIVNNYSFFNLLDSGKLKFLYLLGSDEIKIMLNSPLNAGLFMPLEQGDNGNKTTLLMPIRLND